MGRLYFKVLCLNTRNPMIPPPRKVKSVTIGNAPPPRHVRKEPQQNGLRFQLNVHFESTDEMFKYLDSAYPKGYKVIKSWRVERVACQIEITK